MLFCQDEDCAQAVASAGLDHDALRAAIASGTFETINGPVRFDGVENAITPTALGTSLDSRNDSREAGLDSTQAAVPLRFSPTMVSCMRIATAMAANIVITP